jgi:hypothetical protein
VRACVRACVRTHSRTCITIILSMDAMSAPICLAPANAGARTWQWLHGMRACAVKVWEGVVAMFDGRVAVSTITMLLAWSFSTFVYYGVTIIIAKKSVFPLLQKTCDTGHLYIPVSHRNT